LEGILKEGLFIIIIMMMMWDLLGALIFTIAPQQALPETPSVSLMCPHNK
jgi:cytochrome c oxidase subunit IV